MSGFGQSAYPPPNKASLPDKPAEGTGTVLSTGTDKPTTFGNTIGAGLSLHGNTYEKYQAKDFNKWQLAQAKNLRSKGASDDLDHERKYIEGMMKSVLRGYVCHREVDDYAECLLRRKIIKEDELDKLNINMRQAEVFCEAEVKAYTGCMTRKLNRDTIVEAATGHASCEDLKANLQICLEKQPDDRDVQEEKCLRDYYTLLRCGLNHMWDDYWKKVSGFGTAEEMHVFEVEQDHFKQQAVSKMRERYGT